MKTRNKIAIVGLSMLSILTSCSDDFFDTKNTEVISKDQAFSNIDNVRAILSGVDRFMFKRFADDQGSPGYGGLMINFDVLGEDMVYTFDNGWHKTTYQWVSQNNAQSALVSYPWNFFYKVIQGSNDVINSVDIAVAPQATKDALKGQALVYRAWAHFNLVQVYGKRYVAGSTNSQMGVPIVLISDSQKLARNTVEEVYTQINADLDQAIKLLEGYTRINNSNFDKRVAQGIKARVALTQGNWALAADLAKTTRTGRILMSQADYKKGFNDFKNVEWIWGSRIAELDTESFGNFGAYQSRNFSSTVIRSNPKAINKKLYDLFPDTDVRKGLFSKDGKHPDLVLDSRAKLAPLTSQKFLAFSIGDSRCDVPYMRVAEMFLIEAEALAKAGKDAEAQTVLHELVSARQTGAVKSTLTGSALQDEIMIQRRMELWGEGFRFYDLKRTGSALNRVGTNHNAIVAVVGMTTPIPADDKRWQWLLPQTEINTNPILKQNEF
jgi:hypothetical protein